MLVKEFNCKMTLYVDDLTFSKGNSFNYQKLINYIDIEARKFDHSLKYKTNYKSVKRCKNHRSYIKES